MLGMHTDAMSFVVCFFLYIYIYILVQCETTVHNISYVRQESRSVAASTFNVDHRLCKSYLLLAV